MNAELSRNQRRKLNKRAKEIQAASRIMAAATQQANGQNGNQNAQKRRRSRRNRQRRKGRDSGSSGDLYLRTLLDPKGYPGVKIPDLVSFPSSTFQLTFTGTVGTSSGGDSVGIYAVPIVGHGGNASTNPIIAMSGTQPGNLDTVLYIGNWNNATTIAACYDFYRPVSAILEAEFIGPTTSDGGFWITSLTGSGVNIPTTIDDCLNLLPNSERESFATRKVAVIWRPQDSSDFHYVEPGSSIDNRTIFPGCNIIATGLPADASTKSYILYTFTVNFEGIPGAETLDLISPTPASMDLSGFQRALHSVSNVNPTLLGNTIGNIAGLLSGAASAYRSYNNVRSVGQSLMGSMRSLRLT